MSKYLFILVFCISSSFAQNINQYKYVEVPQKFDFQKENNVYNLNVLTKLLLEKYGFVAYMDDAVKPADAASNNCEKVLRAKIDEESSLFVRRLTVKLLDCQNNIVFTTKQGESSTKDLRVAYNQALRMAFESFDRLQYNYEDRAYAKTMTVDVEPKQDYDVDFKSNTEKAEVISEAKTDNEALSNSEKATQLAMSNSSSTVKIVTEDNLAKATQRTTTDASAKAETQSVEIEFVAKKIENGFLLQSASLPDIRMQKSSIENYYIAQIGDLPAMIYKVGAVWKLDFYKNTKLESKVISIKF